MKIFTQRIALVTALLTVFAVQLVAQTSSYYVEPRFIINSPALNPGPKQFNWSQNPAVASPWGRAIDSVWIDVPVEKAYDTLGANLLLNGTGGYPSLAGKFALIMRGGGISFSQKADYCQRAGAVGVIIVNHKNGGTIGMAPTAPFSTNTTIPVIIISKEDGFSLSEAVKMGLPVTVSLSNWGMNHTNDLGLVNFSPATPHAFSIPLTQITNGAVKPRAFNFYNGAFVANFGTADQTNVRLSQVMTFTPTGGAPSVIYRDSVIAATFPAADSVIELTSPRISNHQFTSTGILDVTYGVGSPVADENMSDNIVNYAVHITDSIYCKSRWNMERNWPLVSSSVRYAAAQPLIWGPLFYVTKGGYRASKAQLAIVGDSDVLNTNTVAPSVIAYLFKWVDANKDGLVNGPELSIVAAGSKSSFSNADSSGKPFTIDLINPKNTRVIPRVEDTAWYMVAAELENDFALGADNETNFFMRNYLSTHEDSSAASRPEYWAPNFTARLSGPNYNVVDDTLSNISFFSKSITKAENVVFSSLTGLVPSMALHLSKTIPTSVESQVASFKKFEIFPNPASNTLNVNLDLGKDAKVVVSVLNASAQGMYYENKGLFKSGTISINTSSYPAGVYYLVVGTDNSTEVKPFTIVK